MVTPSALSSLQYARRIPMAVVEVVVPMLGITIEKGKILKWIKKEGEFVNKG